MTRLAAAGFTGIKRAPRAFGVTANAGVGTGVGIGVGAGQSDSSMIVTSSSGGVGGRRRLGRNRVRTAATGILGVDGEGQEEEGGGGGVYDETS